MKKFFVSVIIFFTFLFFIHKSAFADIKNPSTQICKVAASNNIYPCIVGKNGIRVDKKEGDGATPTGSFLIRRIFYRADKLKPEEITRIKKMQDKGFIVQALTPDDGWVDDVNSSYYNQWIKLSAFKNNLPSHENLWLENDKYDIIAVVGYNDAPVIKGKGSAIFIHIAGGTSTGQYTPTLGCIAFSKQDLLKILDTLTTKTRIEIPNKPEMIVFKDNNAIP